jgi:hypothetical protein
MTRILTAAFVAELEGPHGDGPYDVPAEVTGAISDNGDAYDIRIQEVRVGIETYRPAMLWPRLARMAEDALILECERIEASERRNAKQVADIVNAARAIATVMS